MSLAAIRRQLPLAFLTVSILGISALLLVLPLSTVFRAGFAIIALLISAPIYYGTRDVTNWQHNDQIVGSDWTYAKLLIILAAAALTATAVLGSRFVPVFGFLLFGYAIVSYQIRGKGPNGLLVFEITVLFVVPVFTTYLDAGVYFGGGDTLTHIRVVDNLLAAESLSGLAASNVGYELYPAYHLLIGTISELTGLGAYDSLVLTGTILSSFLVVFSYLFATRLFKRHTIALGCAVAVSLLSNVTYYSIYYFPQSLAVFLIFVGLYLYTQLRTSSEFPDLWQYTFITICLVGLIVFTHHLTFLLFMFAVLGIVCLAVGQFALKLVRSRSIRQHFGNVRFTDFFPVLLGVGALLTYWIYSPSIFLSRFASQFTPDEDDPTATTTALFDVTPADQLELAVAWLASIDGINTILLTVLILVAIYEFIERPSLYTAQIPFFVVGLFSAILLLPLPISVPGLKRLAFALVALSILPIGIAIARGVYAERKVLFVLIAVIALLGATGAFTSPLANDINGIHAEDRLLQTAYSDQEYTELQTASQFIDDRATTPVTTRKITQRSLVSHGMTHKWIEPLVVTEDAVVAPSGLILIKESWTDHYVTVDGGKFAVSTERYRDTEVRQNKVYTAGGTTMLWHSEGQVRLFSS